MGQELSALESVPTVVHPSPVLGEALALAREAHDGPRSRGNTAIEHPLQVGELLKEAGYDEEVVAAGILHDVVEDSTIGLNEIEAGCGPEVRRLVEALTEEVAIEPYARRKAEHRDRIASADRSVAAIYAADKLAKVRACAATGELPPPHKLRHYRRTVKTLSRAYPDLPFLGDLTLELESLIRFPPRGS
jgi:(p)ppGpp synthase/HD superfamily hydrolase